VRRAARSARRAARCAPRKEDDMTGKTNPDPAALKKRLSAEAYHVTQEQGTERPGTSPLLKVKDPGTFKCVVCGEPLFRSETKFESGTGWPSFYAPLGDDAVETKTDLSHGLVRAEVVCKNCGAHLGHVFDDGPRPTGLRYCMNGCALDFEKD
jgi:peptide-methionine (R)-S-oxide reductase